VAALSYSSSEGVQPCSCDPRGVRLFRPFNHRDSFTLPSIEGGRLPVTRNTPRHLVNPPGSRERGSTPAVLNATRVIWWSAFFILWTLQVALYAGVTYYRGLASSEPLSLTEAIVTSAIDWYLWAAICLFCLWLATRFPLERYSWRVLIPTFLAWGVGITLGRGVLDFAILGLLGWDQIPLQERLVVTFPGRFILFVLFLGLGYAVDYARRHREREVSAAVLKAELATAQLQMLKVQLHPHFLFNTLHAISALMYTDVAAADRMLVRLSELLRRTLQAMDAQQVPLAEELSFLEPYMEIEKTRLGKRLRVEMDIAPETLDVLVPHLILQPLVENAVRHGLAPKIEGGLLTVTSAVRDGTLELTVRDDGAGLTPGSARSGGGVGLTNTEARLRHLYGEAGKLAIAAAPAGGVEVRVLLPATRNPNVVSVKTKSSMEVSPGVSSREPVLSSRKATRSAEVGDNLSMRKPTSGD
jgi:two-component system, LytTR family, sensor kinase